MSRLFRRKRVVRFRQGAFPFVERSRRREGSFKLAIVALTLLVVTALIVAAPRGRYQVVSLVDKVASARVARYRRSARPLRNRRRVGEGSAAGNRRYPPGVSESLCRNRSAAATPHEVCRQRPGNGDSAVGQFLADPASPVYGLPARRHRPILSTASQNAISLAEKPDDPAHSVDLFSRARRAGPGRGDAGNNSRSRRWIRPDHQFMGPSRARARAFGPSPRHRAGRLVHARAIHRRPADAAGMPAPAIFKSN